MLYTIQHIFVKWLCQGLARFSSVRTARGDSALCIEGVTSSLHDFQS